MGRLRQSGAGSRLFRGRRTSSRSQSSRTRQHSTTRRQTQISNSHRASSVTQTSQSSQTRQSGQSQSTTKPVSQADQGVRSGTAGASKPSEESAAKQKAESLFSNMFGGTEKAEKSQPAPNPAEEKQPDKGAFSLGNLSDGVSKLFSGEGAKMIQGATQKFDFDK